MAGFDTDAAELFAAETALTLAAGDSRVALNRLAAVADDLLEQGWTGAAAAAFAARWREWLDGAQQALAALDAMAAAFGTTAHAYATAETATVFRT